MFALMGSILLLVANYSLSFKAHGIPSPTFDASRPGASAAKNGTKPKHQVRIKEIYCSTESIWNILLHIKKII